MFNKEFEPSPVANFSREKRYNFENRNSSMYDWYSVVEAMEHKIFHDIYEQLNY